MTKKNSLSPEGISLIITSCEQAGVRVLKYAGLYIEFDKPVRTPRSTQVSEVSPTPDPVEASPITNPTVAEITDIQKREAERNILIDEISLKEDQLADMWIEEPYAAEQLEINSQLEESNGGTPEET